MTELSYKAARNRIQAQLEVGLITPTEHRSQMRAIDRAEARFDKAEVRAREMQERKNERNRRYYHRRKLKDQLLQSLELPA